MVTPPKSRSLKPPRGKQATAGGNGHVQEQVAGRLALSPEMSFCDAGRVVLGMHFDQLLANQAGTIEGSDPECLHDMRVATRRLRAALRDFEPAFEQDRLDPLVKDVRWLAQLLGRIRDLDVFIAWLQRYEQEAPSSQRPFVRRIIEDRQTARVRERAALLSGIASERYEQFTRAFSQFVRASAARTQCGQQPLIDMATSKLERQLRRVRRIGKRVNSKRLKRLHELRIECKRLRYTAESLSTLYPGGLNSLIKRTGKIQDALGRVHDTSIYRQFLKEMRRAQSADSGMQDALTAMIKRLRAEQDSTYKDYGKVYQRLDSGEFRKRLAKRMRQAAKL